MAGRAADPPSGRSEGPQRAKSGCSVVGIPEDLFGFCSPPLTNKYYVNSFAPRLPVIGPGSGRVGEPAQLFGIGVPGNMLGTLRVPGSAGGQPLTDLDPLHHNPNNCSRLTNRPGSGSVNLHYSLIDGSILLPRLARFRTATAGVFYFNFIILIVDMWDNVGYVLFV